MERQILDLAGDGLAADLDGVAGKLRDLGIGD